MRQAHYGLLVAVAFTVTKLSACTEPPSADTQSNETPIETITTENLPPQNIPSEMTITPLASALPTTQPTEAPSIIQPLTPTAELPSYDPLALEVIARLNEWRIGLGLWPLAPNNVLMQMADAQARYILSLPSIPDGGGIHLDGQGHGPRERAAVLGWPFYSQPAQISTSEIAYVGANANAAISFWQGSQIHRDTIVNPAYREVGVAVLPHPYGHIYIVSFGGRPNILPTLLDPVSGMLYLSSEQYRWSAGGTWIHDVTRIQVLPSPASNPDPNGWIPFRVMMPIPEGIGPEFAVAYSDGTVQLIVSVNRATSIAWLPANLPQP